MRVPFKVETIEEYKMCMNMDEKLLKFIDENFVVQDVDICPLNSKMLKVTDKSGESLIFACINDEIKYFEPSMMEEVIRQLYERDEAAQQELEEPELD